MLRHAEAMANDLVKQEALGDKSLVVELASNDGYLPVPVISREPNSRPAITNGSCTCHSPFAGMTQIRFCGRGLVAASQPPSGAPAFEG